MADVKSVDVGGALFVDKCVPSRAPEPRARGRFAPQPRASLGLSPIVPRFPLGECS